MPPGDRQRLSGRAKAAILISTLGADVAVPIMKRLRDREIEALTTEIGRRARITKDMRRNVLEEFSQLLGSGELSGDGGMDFAREILVRAKGEDESEQFLTRIEAAMSEPGFEGLNDMDSSQLVNMIRNEHPQTIAVILCHLKQQLAGAVLSSLPKDLQPEIARRMARFNRVSTDLLKEVETVLNQSFFLVGQGKSEMGGPKSVAEILNTVDGATEKHVLGRLEEAEPEVAEEIRRHMFVFEDILLLTDRDVQRALKDIPTKTLALAMKASSDSVKEHVMKNMSDRARSMLDEEIEMLGPVRLRVVEDAQSEAVDLIRGLENAGEITIERGGEDEDVFV